MNAPLLTRAECTALRGIAIIGIFLHNYCHWLAPVIKENEYQFFSRNAESIARALPNFDALWPMHILSFFGHYGVPLFLFLSAYGLVMKYERGPAYITGIHYFDGAWTFVKKHFLKLWVMMFVGYAAFLMIDHLTPGTHHYGFVDVAAQLLMVNNLLPTPDKVIWPGPFWFFGLMLQLYIVYRLLLYRRHWGWTLGAMALCTLLQMACAPESEELNRWRYNFVGGMLPFGLGLLSARQPMLMNKPVALCLTVISVMMIHSLSMSYYGWFFVPLFVCSFGYSVVKVLPQVVLRPLVWMGELSAALFVCHPITRKIFIPISRHGDLYTGLLIYIVASIALALLFREIIQKFSKA